MHACTHTNIESHPLMVPQSLTVEAAGTVNRMKNGVCVCEMGAICYSNDVRNFITGAIRGRGDVLSVSTALFSV